MGRIKVIVCAVGIAAVAAFSVRVAQVNSRAEVIPIERYGKGEWLDPGDGYLIDESYEDMDGFLLRVDQVRVVTPEEYVEEYGSDASALPEGIERGVPSILAVSMTIRNDGNSTGGFEAYLWRVIPEALNKEYSFDEELFSCVEPTGPVFRVGEGKEVARTFPFTCWIDGPYFTEAGMMRRAEVTDRSFHLNMTSRPVKHVFEFELD